MKLSKEQTLKNILVRIGLKKKPVAKIKAETPKTLGLKLKGTKVITKSKPKVVAKTKHKPKYPKLKLVSISAKEQSEVLELSKTNPKAALALAARKDKEIKDVNRKAMAYNALTEKEKERLAERKETLLLAAASLTENLPKPSDVGIDPNHSYKSLLNTIGKIAFCSSLESNVLWYGDEYNNLSVKIGAETIKLEFEDKEYLDGAVKKLFRWSRVEKSLVNDKGEEPTTSNLAQAIGKAAREYQVAQSKLKSSGYYLSRLVEESTSSEIKYEKGSLRREILAALALEVATIAIKIGFHTDKAKSAFFIDASDNRFGMVEISKKEMLEYMERIAERCKVSGKLTGKNNPSDLMIRVLNHLPL